ncbi:MAG: hypothetical protein JWP89_6190 [Schlesneria sp.]|nr:hypothetical protein [Schlesneria sp.]
MSEYQYVHFIALDGPLNQKQLDYMATQSSRAAITKWQFTNEYNFGDFRGDAFEMLRRGYDVHLHYANYGIRRLLFRLPAGLPWDQETWKRYLPEDGMTWHADKQGRGGILELDPGQDAGTFDSYFMDLEETLEEIAPIRDLLLTGDLRPLYVMWLAITSINYDEEAIEPPLPAGLDPLPDCLLDLAAFYELDTDLLTAASAGSPPLPKTAKEGSNVAAWLDRQSKEDLKRLTQRLLEENPASARAETLTLIRKESSAETWPTVELNRTFEELRSSASEKESRRVKQEADTKQKARRAKLKKLAADPEAVLAQIEKLVNERKRPSYSEAAQMLIDLGEALGPDGPERMQAEATRLSKAYPTLMAFKQELRQHGFLKKKR